MNRAEVAAAAAATPSLFRADHGDGFSPAVLALTGSVWATKRPTQVAVTFAEGPAGVATREGNVAAHTGDAIVTGARGESWPVGRDRFADKYAPVAPTGRGDAGTYVGVPRAVLAVQMNEPFTVVLRDGESRLSGRPRDWLVDHGDGSLGIVASDVFDSYYERDSPAGVLVRLPALHEAVKRILLIGARRASVAPPRRFPMPRALASLIAQITPAHRRINAVAVETGHRYRSAFWSIYLLSALAVLCAVLPFALGWSDAGHPLHRYAVAWAVLEVVIIAIVAGTFWRGHRQKWQGQWLAARTLAELVWYLPLIPPLMRSSPSGGSANWYVRLFGEGPVPRGGPEIDALCQENEPVANEVIRRIADDQDFVAAYARWAVGIFDEQRHYQAQVMHRERALRHRVHALTAWLFGLTAVGAIAHLVFHASGWLIASTFLPALGASLHGALAQSESFRLEITAERLVHDLSRSIADVERALDGDSAEEVLAAVRSTLLLLVEEHRDWQMLVRPHGLPLT